MSNLVYQYYIPYESFDSDIGGNSMPEWALAGSRSTKAYAKICGAEYMLNKDRYFEHLDPRLDSLRLVYDPFFDKYDYILSLDLDMLVSTQDNIFLKEIKDIAMVHEHGIFTGATAGWLHRVMAPSLHDRGIIAYGKYLWGKDWMFPKSTSSPNEPYRYLNGGLQLWSKEGRLKARKYFTSVDHYVIHTRYTEQMYINLQLSQDIFKVSELSGDWNRLPYQWSNGRPDGKINHFLARHKFTMPKLEKQR